MTALILILTAYSCVIFCLGMIMAILLHEDAYNRNPINFFYDWFEDKNFIGVIYTSFGLLLFTPAYLFGYVTYLISHLCMVIYKYGKKS